MIVNNPAEPANASIGPRRNQDSEDATRSTTPQSGDVVLKRGLSNAGSSYTVRQIPGAPQVLCNSRQSAVTFATGFAERHRVAMWEELDGVYTRLTTNTHRAGRS